MKRWGLLSNAEVMKSHLPRKGLPRPVQELRALSITYPEISNNRLQATAGVLGGGGPARWAFAHRA